MALYLVWSNQETPIRWRLIQISITRLFLISLITTTTPATMTKTTIKTTLSPNVVLMFNVFVYVYLLSRYTALVFLVARMVNAINLLIGEWFYFE